MKKKTKWIAGIAALLAAAAAGAGWVLYHAFLPPVRKEKGYFAPEKGICKSAADQDSARECQNHPWPYALLLGCPNRNDGSYSSSQIRRCELAIEAFEKGLYDRLIISGAAVKNQYVEAEQMAKYIRKHSDLPIDIILETGAKSTWENLKNTRLMIGDQPVLILTSSLHARRAAAMASHSFSRFSVMGYPDYRPKHILREMISRLIYIRLEIRKLFTLA